jgi:exopolysaccharide biosynthesis polyprenyl glycosylphosphotransferase
MDIAGNRYDSVPAMTETIGRHASTEVPEFEGQAVRWTPAPCAPAAHQRTATLLTHTRWLLTVDAMIIAAASIGTGTAWPATLIRITATTTALAAAGLYRPRLHPGALNDVARLITAVTAVLPLGLWLGVPTLLTPPALQDAPFVWPVVLVVALLAGRAIGYGAVRRWRSHHPGEACVIIGTGDVAVRLAEVLRQYPMYGLAPTGFVGPPPVTDPALPVPLLGDTDHLAGVVARHRPRHLIVAFPGSPDADLIDTLRDCRSRGLTVYTVPRLFELPIGRTGADLVEGIPLLRMPPESRRLRRRAVKRIIDVVGAAVALLLLSPVLAACALAVRVESGRGRVIFRQVRIGQDGQPFTIYKFRSLTPASTRESQVRWNITTDARLGPVGRILRASSLDELPQFVNVLRGEMSLVGPRPERPFFVEQFERAYAGYPQRHRVPTGITGWAQIHGLRGDTSIAERVRFDNYYIENWSLGMDLKIMLRTAGSMLSIHRR